MTLVILLVFIAAGSWWVNDWTTNDMIETFSSILGFVSLVASIIAVVVYVITYAVNSEDLNEISLEYDTICVKFLNGRGVETIKTNHEKLMGMKASNEVWIFDASVPDRVDELYSKYNKLADLVWLEQSEPGFEGWDGRCPIKR